MSIFLTENFLLRNQEAQRLYHDYAHNMPIYDYHCHLPPEEVANDYKFVDLTDIWLKGDHYKWRALRSHGVDEEFITGNATSYDKYLKYAQMVPFTIGNPIYHWTTLELFKPFGITTLLNENTAQEIWQQANAKLQSPEFSARGIMQQMNVAMIGTTDDPLDSLEHHAKLIADKNFPVKVIPSFRADNLYLAGNKSFNDYVQRLSEATNTGITTYTDFLHAITKRLDYFALHGCKIADHGMDEIVYEPHTEAELESIFKNKLVTNNINKLDADKLKTAIIIFLGTQYYKRGWVQQYHIGAMRNNNTRMLHTVGINSGFDSISDQHVAYPLSKLLDAQDKENSLPKTILYCLNPKDNEVLATMIGNFQGNGIKGKMQFGSGWWFNDQKDGMKRQLTQLSQLGLLAHFVGMLTDSRSFLSYTRHEYFRRILCQMLGDWMHQGEIPTDYEFVGGIVRNICFNNARDYFGIELSI